MNPLTDARERVAAALSGIGVPVLPAMPRTAAPPCVVVTPGSPWIRSRDYVTLDVVAHAPSGSWTQLEDIVNNLRAALWSAGLAPGDTNVPGEAASTITASTPVTLRTCH